MLTEVVSNLQAGRDTWSGCTMSRYGGRIRRPSRPQAWLRLLLLCEGWSLYRQTRLILIRQCHGVVGWNGLLRSRYIHQTRWPVTILRLSPQGKRPNYHDKASRCGLTIFGTRYGGGLDMAPCGFTLILQDRKGSMQSSHQTNDNREDDELDFARVTTRVPEPPRISE